MKKRIQVTIEKSLLEALESELQRLQKEKGISRSKSSVIEEALSDWISWQRDKENINWVQIGVDIDGQPILVPENEVEKIKSQIKKEV